MDDKGIADIVARVLNRLRESTSLPKEKILLLYEDGSWIHYEDVIRAAGPYSSWANFHYIGTSEIARFTNEVEEPELSAYAGVVVCPCSQSTLVELALGLTISPFSKVAVNALWWELPVLLVLYPPFSRLLRSSGDLPAYGQKMKEYIEQLRDYGAKFATWAEFRCGQASILNNRPFIAEKASNKLPAQNTWLTTNDIKQKIVAPGGVVRLPRGMKLTPLAKDLIREMGMAIEFMKGEENREL